MATGGLRLVKIIPKSLPLDPVWAQAQLDDALTTFAGAMVRDMASYPAAQPWTSRPPRTGPRAGGRRTGALGRNWRITNHARGRLIEVANPIEYAPYVQGPPNAVKGQRQTAVMASRGWQTITGITSKNWPRTRTRINAILTGRAPHQRKALPVR